jgi:hypothetical protein
VQISGALVDPQGTLTVLTSQNAEDENSFEQPEKIKPVSRTIRTGNPSKVLLAPYSLNILRFHTKDTKK